ncbi:UNVERIFIED_CONTAM: cyclophilin family peptidyl-prolyl cis-trans isomerase [Acetivibrio alkalicellulosi]
MFKRIIITALCVMLIFAAGCGDKKPDSGSTGVAAGSGIEQEDNNKEQVDKVDLTSNENDKEEVNNDENGNSKNYIDSENEKDKTNEIDIKDNEINEENDKDTGGIVEKDVENDKDTGSIAEKDVENDKVSEESAEEESKQENREFDQLGMPEKGDTIAIMRTSMGDIKIRLFPDIAPKTVENFVTHAQNGYYDGVIFHRVINQFMIQGGDPLGTGTGGESIWGKPFKDEFSPMVSHLRGALSMANRGPNTNGSQFFIVQNIAGTPHLNGGHTVFGQVFDGMDVVDKIAGVRVGPRDRPLEDVTILSIGVEILE